MRESSERAKQSRKTLSREKVIRIESRDYWVNIVDFMQNYWALIDRIGEEEQVRVYFIQEGSHVFATMEFDSHRIAERALLQNGFKKLNDPYENFSDYLTPPGEPFYQNVHRQGKAVTS